MIELAVEGVKAALEQFDGSVISLLTGQPYYPPADGLVEAMERAAREGNHEYGPPGGLPGLKEVICRREADRGVMVSPENIVVGNGSKALLFGLLSLLGHRGVLLPRPTYPPLRAQTALLGHRVHELATAAPDFRLDSSDLMDSSAASKILVFSSPANPTGVTLNPREAAALLDRVRAQDIYIIADEVYGDLAYDPRWQSLGSLNGGLRRLSLVRSFSKSHGICGWRLGYVLAEAEVAAAVVQWQSATLNPPSTIVQRAVELTEGRAGDGLARHRDYFAETAGLLRSLFAEIGLPSVRPQGGFYLFVNAEPILARWHLRNSTDLCTVLARDYGLGFWPGEDFNQPGWFRISFAGIPPSDRGDRLAELTRRLEFALDQRGS